MIYRVHGVDKQGQPSSVDVECGGEAVARNVAVRKGLVNTSAVEIISDDMAFDVVRPQRGPTRAERGIVSLSIGSMFKIAAAIFLGMLAHSIALWIISGLGG